MKTAAEMENRESPVTDPPKRRDSGGGCGGLGLLWFPNRENVPIDPSRPTSVPPPHEVARVQHSPLLPSLNMAAWPLVTMEAGALNFFVICFQIPKTDLGTHSSYL